jgi:hypothetical protein
MTLAVMGCIVNGPGESKAASIGISLPGTGEEPRCPVYIDGQKFTTLEGSYEQLDRAFRALVDDYVATKYTRRSDAPAAANGDGAQAASSDGSRLAGLPRRDNAASPQRNRGNVVTIKK